MSCLRRVLAILVLVSLTQAILANEPLTVAGGNPPSQPRQPQIVVDEKGTVHATYGAAGVVYYARLEAGSPAFDAPVKVGDVAGMALGRRRGPRIGAGSDSIVIAAIGHEDGNVRAWRSADGKRWDGPVTVNDSPRDAREGLHSLARGPKGELFCVWLDCRQQERGQRLFGASSKDGGRTWTANREIYRSPSGTICECCHPSVTFDASGKLLVMWRNSVAGSRDMYWTSSTDGGQSFGKATKLGAGTWPLNACPMDGGNIAAAPGGELFTAWRRDKEVFLTSANRTDEQLLGTGQQPWIGATERGPHVVWLQQGGKLLYMAPGAREPQELASQASDPVIVCGPAGKGPLVAAWEAKRGSGTAVMCQVLSDQK